MSALLIKDAPDGLHQWLKTEASCNRRSLNQQVLVCLEWCMRAYGRAQPRDPFAQIMEAPRKEPQETRYANGSELVNRLLAIEPLDDADATRMKRSLAASRKAKARELDYACFA